MIKDTQVPAHKEADCGWQVSGLLTAERRLRICGDMKDVKYADAGDVFVEYFKVDEMHETGKRAGFVKSIEHVYVHVNSGNVCDSLWQAPEDDVNCKEWNRKWTAMATGVDVKKRDYKKMMPIENKVECDCGCERAIDDCDEEFGRNEG